MNRLRSGLPATRSSGGAIRAAVLSENGTAMEDLRGMSGGLR
ncbi:hypothetical protein ACVW1A_005279 [Bradyrhizobium sp. LB1.3]